MHPPPPSSRNNGSGTPAANMGYYGTPAPPAEEHQYYVPPSGPHAPLASHAPHLSHVLPVPPVPAGGLPQDFTTKAMQQASISTLVATARSYGVPPPTYDVKRVGGEDHKPIFRCTIGWDNDSMNETVDAGSKPAARRKAAMVMIQRLNQLGIGIFAKQQSRNAAQHPPNYHQQQYQVQQPSYYVDRGIPNSGPPNGQLQYQRGLNMPGRNGSANGIVRPAVKSDPYANDSFGHNHNNSRSAYSPSGNRGGYGNGNGRQPSSRGGPNSYEQNQINRSNHHLARRPLYNQSRSGTDSSRHSRPDPRDNRRPLPPNRRDSAPYRPSAPPAQAQPQAQYNRRMPKTEPGPVDQPVRYAPGGSEKLSNNQNVPDIPVPRRGNGASNGIALGDSKDPRVRRKAVFGGAPTPPPAPETDTAKDNDSTKKTREQEVPEKPKTARQSFYEAAVLGPTAKKTSTDPALKKESPTPKSLTSSSVAPTPIKLKNSPPPVPSSTSIPEAVAAESKKAAKSIPTPASSSSVAMSVRVSSSPGSTMASKLMGESRDMKHMDFTSGTKLTTTPAVEPMKEKPAPVETKLVPNDTKPKDGTTDKAAVPDVALNPTVTATKVKPARKDGDSGSGVTTMVTEPAADKMEMTPTKKDEPPVKMEPPAEAARPLKVKDVTMKDVEASRTEIAPVKVTAEPVKSPPKKEAPPTKGRTWEITPPPRRSNRNRTPQKKMAEGADQTVEIISHRRTRSMTDNKRTAEAMTENNDNKPSPKVARVAKAEKDDAPEPDMLKIFETESISSKSEKSDEVVAKNKETPASMDIVTVPGISFGSAPKAPKTKLENVLVRSGLPAKKRPRFNRMKLWIYANGDELSVYQLLRNATWTVHNIMDISVHVYGTTTIIPTPQILPCARRSITHEMEKDVPSNAVYSIVAAKSALQAAKLNEMREKGNNSLDVALSRVLIVSSSDCIIAATEGMTLVKANVVDEFIKDIADEYRRKHNLASDP